jgi:hypothetical protein
MRNEESYQFRCDQQFFKLISQKNYAGGCDSCSSNSSACSRSMSASIHGFNLGPFFLIALATRISAPQLIRSTQQHALLQLFCEFAVAHEIFFSYYDCEVTESDLRAWPGPWPLALASAGHLYVYRCQCHLTLAVTLLKFKRLSYKHTSPSASSQYHPGSSCQWILERCHWQ